MTLMILLEPGPPNRAARWLDFESGDTGEGTPLGALSARIADDEKKELVVALAGEDALSRVMALPMKSERDLRRAATLVLEDQTAAPIEGPVLAFAPEEDGKRLTSVLREAVIADTLDALAEFGLDPDILTIDHACLPEPEEGEVVVLRLGPRTAVRSEDGAFTSEADFAEAVIGASDPETVTSVGLDDLEPEFAPNFRTGAFRKRRALPDWRPYRLAASLALVAGAVFLLANLAEGTRYASAASVKRQQAEANFSRAFPGTPIVDMERQIRGRANGRQGSDFLPLAANLAEVLRTQETTTLSSLTYSADGELTAELTFASFSDLEAVTAALSERGIVAEEGSDTRREDGALVTRLFLRAA